MNALPPELDSTGVADRHVVTASDLVRHFGVWQDIASRAPVYVLHRGRPRHVLTSIDVMNALCAPHEQAFSAAGDSLLAALLDFIDDIILLVEPSLRIAALSLTARRFFGARPGDALGQLVAPSVAPVLADAVERVLARGIIERIELAAARYPDRRLGAAIAPHGHGVAIKLSDASLADEVAARRACQQGESEASIAAGGLASATIDSRGCVSAASASLSAMTGLDAQELAGMRITSLVDGTSRAPLDGAIEAVLAGQGPIGLGAALLVEGGSLLSVRLGLGAIRHGAAITGAAVAIAQDAPVLRDT